MKKALFLIVAMFCSSAVFAYGRGRCRRENPPCERICPRASAVSDENPQVCPRIECPYDDCPRVSGECPRYDDCPRRADCPRLQKAEAGEKSE